LPFVKEHLLKSVVAQVVTGLRCLYAATREYEGACGRPAVSLEYLYHSELVQECRDVAGRFSFGTSDSLPSWWGFPVMRYPLGYPVLIG